MGYYLKETEKKEALETEGLTENDLMLVSFKNFYASAIKKDNIEDLSNDEICAIGVFANVPYETELDEETNQLKITFTVAFGVWHDGMRWQVTTGS